jgi:flagellar biosynthesis protein FlhF
MGGPLLTPNDRHKIVMLVGPTGGGKTLTAAKLAAHYRLKEGRSVALIKVESGRVSAVDPLQLFAATIGLGVDIVRNKRELTECLWLRRETDLVLIDTAGRSPLDHDAMGELRDCAALESTIEVHLVIPARIHAQDLADLIDRYAGLPIHRLVCTKLDETTRYGVLFDSLCRTKLSVSYFGVGQRVTDDLEVARPEEMVDLLLGRAGQSDEPSHEWPQPEPALSGMRTGGAESPTPYGEDRRPSFEGGYTWISR